MSRSQRDVTWAKNINNSAWDCSISLQFITDYDHVTHNVPQTFKVSGSNLKVTA